MTRFGRMATLFAPIALVVVAAGCSSGAGPKFADAAAIALPSASASATASPTRSPRPSPVRTPEPPVTPVPTPEPTPEPAATAVATPDTPPPSGYVWVMAPEAGFHLAVPSAWLTLNASDVSSLADVIESMKAANPQAAAMIDGLSQAMRSGTMPVVSLDPKSSPTYMTNVNVLISPPMTAALGKMATTSMARQIETQFKLKSGSVKVTDTSVGGVSSEKLEYSASFDTASGAAAKATVWQYVVFGPYHTYIVSLESTSSTFNRYSSTFKAIIGTFALD